MTAPMQGSGRRHRFVDEVRRLVLSILFDQAVPRTVWGVASAKVAGTPPRYTFRPEGASTALRGTYPYLGANAPVNGETVMGMWVGPNLFLVYRQTGTS